MLGDKRLLEHTLSEKEREVLARVASSVRARWGEDVHQLRVFGSRARGDCDADSDIDLLVVLRVGAEEEWRASDEVIQLALEAMRRPEGGLDYVPIAPTVLSQERFAEMERRERRLALDALNEGIAL